MDGDMNNIFQKLNTILENKDMSDNLKDIFNNFSSSNESTNTDTSKNTDNTKDASNANTSSTKSNDIPEFDINTILKMKSIMDSFNDNSNDPRSNLLLSLKPYLGETKKDKIDQYVKFLHLAKVFEVINPLGGDDKKNE